jgi:superoxide dismutase
MPRKAKETPAAPAEQPQVRKSEQVRQAWRAHPRMEPKEITALLQAQGLDVSSAYVSQIKFQMNQKKGKMKAKAAAAPAATAQAAAPALPKDAVSLGLLQKAKKLAAQFGSLKEAKQAIDALAQLMD